MDKYFTTRRTRRVFLDREVPIKLIDRLLEAAAHAPTTGNMQLYSVVVTTDPEERKALAAPHFNQPAATGAAALLTFCADFTRFTRWCEINNADAGYDNLQGLTTAILDTMALTQQFCTLAELEGLGTCYLGTTTYNAPQIVELLRLPRLTVPVTTIAVGWPADEGEDVGRLPARAFIHHGHYHMPDDAAIGALYAEKEARADSRRFVEENGKQNLAQVFTDVRYTRGMMESFSKVWLDLLRAQGYSI